MKFPENLLTYFVVYKRSPLKMQKITKLRCPSRQLLETVNFAFMKIFDFLVKIAVFRASLFLGEIRVMHFFPDHKFDYDHNPWRESPKKRRDVLKTAILTKKSKIFIKAKLTVSKSCLLGHLGFMIFCVLRGDLL